MSKASKLFLAALTVWPVLYVFVFISAAFFTIIFNQREPGMLWAVIIPIHILTMLLAIGLTVYYIVHLFRNEKIKSDMKAFWAIVLFMGGAVAMPIYWFLYIWRENTPAFLNPASLPSQIDPASTRQDTHVPPAQPPDWR